MFSFVGVTRALPGPWKERPHHVALGSPQVSQAALSAVGAYSPARWRRTLPPLPWWPAGRGSAADPSSLADDLIDMNTGPFRAAPFRAMLGNGLSRNRPQNWILPAGAHTCAMA